MTDTRITSYTLGYGHGASDREPKYPTNPSYMAGWSRGSADAYASLVAFCESEGLPLPAPERRDAG